MICGSETVGHMTVINMTRQKLQVYSSQTQRDAQSKEKITWVLYSIKGVQLRILTKIGMNGRTWKNNASIMYIDSNKSVTTKSGAIKRPF